MGRVKSFKDLEVWQLAKALVAEVYKLLESFPKEEKYGIIAQSKNSVVSVPGNIAESFGRFHLRDKIQFLYNARGSLSETESHLLVSQTVGFINQTNRDLFQEILADIQNLGVKLNNYINSLWQSTRKPGK